MATATWTTAPGSGYYQYEGDGSVGDYRTVSTSEITALTMSTATAVIRPNYQKKKRPSLSDEYQTSTLIYVIIQIGWLLIIIIQSCSDYIEEKGLFHISYEQHFFPHVLPRGSYFPQFPVPLQPFYAIWNMDRMSPCYRRWTAKLCGQL
jgi:hypothetical protein